MLNEHGPLTTPGDQEGPLAPPHVDRSDTAPLLNNLPLVSDQIILFLLMSADR